MNNSFYIMCNGKSASSFDFNELKGKNWIGMNLAYRYWSKVNIYPTHYICLDESVLRSNLEDIKRLVIDKRCQHFLFPNVMKNLWYDSKDYKNIQFFEAYKNTPENPFRYLVDWCTGSAAILWAYCYLDRANESVDLHLIGADCNYIEFLPECKETITGSLIITKTPEKNPNYFFDDYQRCGDIYNIPNTTNIHLKSWNDIRNIFILYSVLTKTDIKVMNYSDSGKLDHLFACTKEKWEVIDKD